jgi:phosphate transport system protein
MERQFEKELESLKTTLIKMGSLVEDAVRSALDSFLSRDEELARRVIAQDERINNLEIEVDHAIIDLLALRQPVAVDLRFLLSAQKINNDLERMGDHAVNIAESSLGLLRFPPPGQFQKLTEMVEVTKLMLQQALDGFIHQDPGLARAVLIHDDRIDALNRELVTDVMHAMKGDATTIESGLDLIRISRNLERVADLATNISEEIIFIAQALVVKHHAEDRPKAAQQP